MLARDPDGYRRLCRVISAAQVAGGEKGRPVYDIAELAAAHEGHWLILTGCRKGAVPAALAVGGLGTAGQEAAARELSELAAMFGRDNVVVELTSHDQPADDERNDVLFELARATGTAAIATNNVHYADPARARLGQALAAIRARRSLDEMDGWLAASGAAYLRSGTEMTTRLRRYPGVFERTMELASDCAFDFKVIAPKLPDYPLAEGETEAGVLRELVARKALERYGPPHSERVSGAYRQIQRELKVIEELEFPGYFLIVHDIVQFCEDNGILCQGRGSAANSAVCYAIGITSVDSVQHGLLFERFLSSGRDGPPDIDLDIEHRRREEVIQYVYRRYGRGRAAQVANVISYRPRMALRDAGRALGYSPQEQDQWAAGRPPAVRPRPADSARLGCPRGRRGLAGQLQRLPRHLGIHSGGMVICDRPVGEVCPVEWARMPGRTVLQWDKDDCAYAGLVKFDLLGLGMLSALRDCFELVEAHHGKRWSLRVDSAGGCQRLRDALRGGHGRGLPGRVARPDGYPAEAAAGKVLRPGDRGRADQARPDPGRLGAPLHAAQARRGAAGPAAPVHGACARQDPRRAAVPGADDADRDRLRRVQPDEADRLRQAMSSSAPRSGSRNCASGCYDGMAEGRSRLASPRTSTTRSSPSPATASPKSHAISFAYLVYASAWLKRYYPAAFTAALLRNQPMGFYAPASLISDARPARRAGRRRRHQRQRGPRGQWRARKSRSTQILQRASPGPSASIRPACPTVRNLGAARRPAVRIVAGQPYAGLEDFARRPRCR